MVENATHHGVDDIVDRLRLAVEGRHRRENDRPGASQGREVLEMHEAERRFPRGTTMSVRRSLSMTSAARVRSVSEMPCAMRATVPIEHGMTTIACHPALPLAKGAA